MNEQWQRLSQVGIIIDQRDYPSTAVVNRGAGKRRSDGAWDGVGKRLRIVSHIEPL
jgi:hypothetical protein